MKKAKCILIVLLILSLFSFPISMASAQIVAGKPSETSLLYRYIDEQVKNFSLIDEPGFIYISNELAVQESSLVCNKQARDLLQNSNISILYNMDADNVGDNVAVSYYKNGIYNTCFLKSNTVDRQELKAEINDFVNEKLSDYYVNGAERASEEKDGLFTTLFRTSFRETKKPYGYIDCDYYVMKYRASDVSSLYIVDTHVYFTPGRVARDLGDTTYKNYWNLSGYFKIWAGPAENEVGYGQVRYGGTPVFVEAYPINAPTPLTIYSGFTAGLKLGHSFNNGFSKDGLSMKEDWTQGLNIDYSYSKTYAKTDPAMTAQKDPSDAAKFTWSYQYNKNVAETNHMLLGYVYEMNNNGHDLHEGDVLLKFDYGMTVQTGLIKKNFVGSQNHDWY